jgi:hypothetical protein
MDDGKMYYIFSKSHIRSFCVAGSNNILFLGAKIMKKITILLLFLCMTSQAVRAVSTRVCLSDGNTPLELADPCIPFVYRDIMVGTKLTIIVWSDVNKPWGFKGGGLAIEEQYWDYGILSARGPKVGEDWTGSHFPAAGNEAAVLKCEESGIDGFYLYSGSTGVETGDWFIIDYTALDINDCNVGFYDYNMKVDEPVHYLSFTHVPTRDFNNDTEVDFCDYAILASHWQATDCNEPCGWCEGADLDIDGNVDSNDLMLFCEYWLEKTGYERPRDFNKDTKVDFADFAMLASHWLVTDCGYPGWCQGTDIDADGDVDFDDLTLFVEYWLERTE